MFGSGQTFAGGEVEGGGEPLTYGPFLTPRRVKCQFSFRCFVRKSCRQLEGASVQPLREKCSLPSSICDAGSALLAVVEGTFWSAFAISDTPVDRYF